jgi:serine protease Do
LRKYFPEQYDLPSPEPSVGQGSGVIIRDDGYILTNGHVVNDAERIEVRLRDGRRFKGTLRGLDPKSDVAVIKIEAKGLPAATFADSSKTRVGEFAIAIGAPFSLDYSVTFGHVSAKSRSNVLPPTPGGEGLDQDFIQTDANINPGNSGGPLVNINGEVIGMNTLIRGLHTGIGFAIPSNLAREVSDQLIAKGKFTRAWLGIAIDSVRDDDGLRQILKGVAEGVVVRRILTNGPAAKSDLKMTDVITAVDGRPVSTPQQLRGEIRSKKIGQAVALNVVRDGKAIQVKVRPAEWTEPVVEVAARTDSTEKAEAMDLGITVRTLTRELANQFGIEITSGVAVVAVDKGSPAARHGIKPGDVITSVTSGGTQHSTANPSQYLEAIQNADFKKGIVINLSTPNGTRLEVLKEE